ncbi:asparagine synthase-related protein [Embleya hyalina]|uniref:asparagine synthase-related protein n=1 Tax=Embleya hyalina TaxID=516124 RepID=UPI000F83EE11|nr:asparagine synthase-related protein [Embleya hyalina]
MVLPDTDAGARVAERLRDEAPAELRDFPHASGRPWLLGRWSHERLTVARVGERVVALSGEHDVTEEWLTARLSRTRDMHGVDALVAALAGSTHVLASFGGTVRVQGTATGLRRVFHARVDGVPVASDRADVPAALSGASVDPGRLAARMLFMSAPWPMGWDSVWDTVRAVRPGDHLTFDRNGTARESRWWSPPPPELSLAEAAKALREALTEAVAVRTAPGETVAAHLSGLDSSALVSAAAQRGADVVALTAAQPDVLDDDVAWARRTVAELARAGRPVRHEVLAAAEVPLVYDGILTARDGFDEPFLMQHNREPYRHILHRGQRHDPRLHFAGFGGDETCATAYQWLPLLLRRHPSLGFRHLRAVTAKYRWSWPGVARSILDRSSYPQWLRHAANSLPNHRIDLRQPEFGWGTLPVLPGWVSDDAVDAVRGELRRAAEANPIIDTDRGVHIMLSSIHAGAQITRGFQHIAAAEGVPVSAPFFDDRVLNAVASVRLAERYDPTRYKPLLVEAMRGIVPDATLGRTTKASTPANAVLGSREHRDQLVGLARDSALVRLGIADPAGLRHACHGPIEVEEFSRRLEPTIACEIWLRDHDRAHTRT